MQIPDFHSFHCEHALFVVLLVFISLLYSCCVSTGVFEQHRTKHDENSEDGLNIEDFPSPDLSISKC